MVVWRMNEEDIFDIQEAYKVCTKAMHFMLSQYSQIIYYNLCIMVTMMILSQYGMATWRYKYMYCKKFYFSENNSSTILFGSSWQTMLYQWISPHGHVSQHPTLIWPVSYTKMKNRLPLNLCNRVTAGMLGVTRWGCNLLFPRVVALMWNVLDHIVMTSYSVASKIYN